MSGSCDARVEDVADDRDVKAVDSPNSCWIVPQVERAPASGCWCLPSPALTMCAPVCCDKVRCADLRVPDHDHVRVVRADRDHGVLERRSPLSTAEPDDLRDIVSAERRFAGEAKQAASTTRRT